MEQNLRVTLRLPIAESADQAITSTFDYFLGPKEFTFTELSNHPLSNHSSDKTSADRFSLLATWGCSSSSDRLPDTRLQRSMPSYPPVSQQIKGTHGLRIAERRQSGQGGLLGGIGGVGFSRRDFIAQSSRQRHQLCDHRWGAS